MNEKTLEQNLLDQHGPLMSARSTAELFGCTQGGLLNAIYRATPFGLEVARARVKIGRRVLFRTSDIARLVS